jgi:hypothetical protein
VSAALISYGGLRIGRDQNWSLIRRHRGGQRCRDGAAIVSADVVRRQRDDTAAVPPGADAGIVAGRGDGARHVPVVAARALSTL